MATTFQFGGIPISRLLKEADTPPQPYPFLELIAACCFLVSVYIIAYICYRHIPKLFKHLHGFYYRCGGRHISKLCEHLHGFYYWCTRRRLGVRLSVEIQDKIPVLIYQSNFRFTSSSSPPTVLRRIWLTSILTIKRSWVRSNVVESNNCPICFDEFLEGEQVRIVPRCSHMYHRACIDPWFTMHSSCPCCRVCVIQ